MTIARAATPVIPASHAGLLGAPNCGVFTTLGLDGFPQSSLVWLDSDGNCPLINTTLQRQKGRNLSVSPRASLLVVDAANTARYLQVRGDVEFVFEGAQDQLDELTRSYTGRPAYYGFIYPASRREHETRVICRLHPRRVTLDAIHA